MSAGYGFEISFLFTMVIAILTGSAQGVLIGLGGNPIVVTLGAAGLLYGLGAYWSDILKTLFIQLLHVGEADEKGERSLTFELHGKARTTIVLDKSVKAETKVREKADPANPMHVAAPIPAIS